MRVIARCQHVGERAVLWLGYREVPGYLDGDPVDGVLTPIGLVFWLPLVGPSGPFRTVGAGCHYDEVLRVAQVVGVELLAFG